MRFLVTDEGVTLGQRSGRQASGSIAGTMPLAHRYRKRRNDSCTS